MKFTEDQIRSFVKRELQEAQRANMRKIIKEELMTEASEKTLVKRMRIPAEEMEKKKQPFLIKGFKENEVEIIPIDNYVIYSASVNTKVEGKVTDETMIKIAQMILPKFYPTGIEKNEKVITTLKAKGQRFDMGDIIQTLRVELPDNLEVKYI